MSIDIEMLSADNFGLDSLDGFVRHQRVEKVWKRTESGLRNGYSFPPTRRRRARRSIGRWAASPLRNFSQKPPQTSRSISSLNIFSDKKDPLLKTGGKIYQRRKGRTTLLIVLTS